MLGRDRSDGTGPSARQPVLGAPAAAGAAAGLTFRLATVPGDPAEPFVVLHEGRFSRHYLVEVTSGEAPVTRFVWKVQNDAAPPRLKGQGPALTNPEIDDLWQREVDGLAAVRSPNVVAGVPVPAALLASPPIVHCRKVDRYFHPVCAATGAVLTVCRDDGFLADCGLVPYGEDTWRYLHAGDRAAPTQVFYRIAGANHERPRDGVVVRLGNQLFRDWATLVHGPERPAAVAAAAVLPCLSCEHRQTCYPGPAVDAPLPAEAHLRPVSFYDVRAAAMEALDVDYDELCDLLGGAGADEVLAGSAVPGRAALLQPKVAALQAPGQWLFAGDPVRFPLEVLRQKLSAFLEVCSGLAAVHGALGRPHFAVAPSNVMATLGDGGSGVPRRWTFRTALIDLGSPHRVVPATAGRDDLGELLGPGPELREDLSLLPYVAPDLHGVDGQSASLPVACRVATAADGGRELLVEGQGVLQRKPFGAGDLVAIAAGDAVLWARLRELRARAFTAAARLPDGHACLQWDGKRFEARVAFHRHFGPPVDLHGLGMLLFRTLLVDDTQSMADVADAVAKVRRRLEDEVGEAVDERLLGARLQQLLAGKDLKPRFDAAHVLFPAAARTAATAGGRAAIDPGLWQELLRIGFRLATRWPGFSYSHGHAEASPFVLRQVQADVEVLRQRVQVELFQRAELEATIAVVANQLLTELRSQMLSEPPLETTRASVGKVAGKGFRLVVERDGDAGAPQEFQFDRDQVTIGRREVESLVRLNDPMVSSAHALIERQAAGYVLIDRNSTNGTEVDGIRLPGDVPQPLEDGTVILIRPFRLTFRLGGGAAGSALDATSVVHTVTADQLADRLHAAYAAHATGPDAQRQEALRRVLTDARTLVGDAELAARLEQLTQRFRAGAGDGAAAAAELQAKFFTSAHRALALLSRSLIGPGDFATPEDVQAFAGRLGRFVETTSQWIERTLELRRALGKHLELGTTTMSGGKASVRTAAEVRQLLLGWSQAHAAGDPSGWFLAKFYEDVVATIEGLLAGTQQVRRAIRERLDPQRLVDQASKDAKIGLFGNAANSALWKLYVQTFQEVTEGKQFELELDRLLQKSLQDHRPR
ncbi:MAG: FHA domain-containing protein [Planctomycetes bacterium]|nr:FHA domain-containing protein [Planctomycetota bacterium]